MLTAIKSPSDTKIESAAELLLGCHERIRHFTAVSLRLAEAVSAPAEEVAGAAESVWRYFSIALPLHEADENQSLHPRLRVAAPEALAAASAEMVHQHLAIDVVVAELLPVWDTLRQRPERLPELAAVLAEKSHQLLALWETHLALEERTVFPAMQKYLSAAELDAIRDEMKARRTSA
jgi:hemerythrin-like domain-containing protein